MTTKTKTIKGWANDTNYFTNQNVSADTFMVNLERYVREKLIGYKYLRVGQTLKGKKATQKVIIKGWCWKGNWSNPSKETIYVYYK